MVGDTEPVKRLEKMSQRRQASVAQLARFSLGREISEKSVRADVDFGDMHNGVAFNNEIPGSQHRLVAEQQSMWKL